MKAPIMKGILIEIMTEVQAKEMQEVDMFWFFAIDNIKDLNLIYFNLFVMPGKRTSFLHVCNQDFHNI